jgi:hypothetical protein
VTLWAITSYFNPASYRTRKANYLAFRERLNVPLVTVELSHSNAFELGQQDADIMVHLSEKTVLWQKERLLNVALKALPDSCTAVAWLDCDIVFADDDWSSRALEALTHCTWSQPFQNLVDATRGARLEDLEGLPRESARRSVVRMLESGELPGDFFGMRGASLKWKFTAGHAWVARREALESCGLYDGSIMGSGNKLMLAAGYGKQEDAARAYGLNESQRAHYLHWADIFNARMGKPGWIDGQVFHLWHGDLEQRGYGNRHGEFQQFGFDPFRDIAKSAEGAWRWSSDKPEMHQYVENYFLSRREDG